MKKLDQYTLGDSEAAVTLVKILNKNGNRRHASKVQKWFSRFNQTMYAIHGVKNPVICARLSRLVMKEEKNMINKSILPKIVKSYLLNIMKVTYRNCVDFHEFRSGKMNPDNKWKKMMNRYK